MLRRYRVKNYTFFDLSGWGKEGRIEGLEYNELIDVILDVANELSDADMEFVLTAVGQELLKREK